MKTSSTFLLLFFFILSSACDVNNRNNFNNSILKILPDTISHNQDFPSHLQGIATNFTDRLFWSYTTKLMSTDLQGEVVQIIDVPTHHGDLAYSNDKIYVAVNLGEFNKEPGFAKSWIYVYESQNLSFIERISIPEVEHGAGGIAIHNGKAIVVGGLPDNGNYHHNFLYEYDLAFNFQKRYEIDGFTLMGIQSACYNKGFWYFGCYGNPKKVLKVKQTKGGDMELDYTYIFDMSYGLIGLDVDEFLYSNSSLESKAVKIKVRELD